MIIYIGADHQGFKIKETLKKYLTEGAYTVIDAGNTKEDPNDDYPDFAAGVAYRVSEDPSGRKGILVCGSGAGVCITANKFPRIRASIACSADHAFIIRNDDDTNILCIAASLSDEDQAKMIAATWLQTPFSGEEKHKRRISKIRDIEMMPKE